MRLLSRTNLKGVFIMNELMIFEGHEVEAFELNGEVLFKECILQSYQPLTIEEGGFGGTWS